MGYPAPVELPPLPPPLDSPLAPVVLVFLVALGLLLGVRAAVLSWLGTLTGRTSSTVDDFVLDAVRLPSLFWVVALGADLSLRASALPEGVVALGGDGIRVLVLVSATLVISNAAAGLLTARLGRAEGAGVSGIARTLVRGVVLLVGAAAILNQLGVSIGPILAGLGVGGLAVALALQDTLGNFFAGVHILLEKPFAIGHFIRIDGGEAGWVQDIGWRTTRILTLAEHTVVVPNSQIAGSKIVNMNLPDPTVRVEFTLGLGYGSDPTQAEAVLLAAARAAVSELAQCVTEPPPDVLLEGFGDYALQYTVRFHIRQVAAERVALHHVRTRVLHAIRAAGLEIPFPVRTVHLVREESP